MLNRSRLRLPAYICCLLFVLPGFVLHSHGQSAAAGIAPAASSANWTVHPEWVRAHEEFLASDAMRGRGSATPDEWVAAAYIGSELREFGVEPAASDGSYVQKIELDQKVVSEAPTLKFGGGASPTTLAYGKDFFVFRIAGNNFTGPLQKIDMAKPAGSAPANINKGAVVLLVSSSGNSADRRALMQQLIAATHAGAAAVLLPGKPPSGQRRCLPCNLRSKGIPADPSMQFNALALPPEAMSKLSALADGTPISFELKTRDAEPRFTYNAMGILRGSDPNLKSQVVLLTAHLDHLGVGKPVNGDAIYNGADDDASGVTAVLELARALAAGAKLRRTVLFVCFGSEESGGHGALFFRENPPVPLQDLAANLEFEMIGRRDPAVRPDELWLTGWERSNLGPELTAHGAKLVADPHPAEQFFARSDNYALALKGVVAQTVSSFGLHSDYHQPSDDIAHLDFAHMTAAIQSMVEPVRWLANSDFKPQWKPGGKP